MSGIEHKDSINSLAFVDGDSGSHVEYGGPFAFTRDGGTAEVTIPVDPDDYAGIYETTAENLTDREGDLAVAVADGGIEVTGFIDAAVIEEGRLVVAIDDGNYAGPSDIDIDPSEVDRDV
ncbi:hypothetical protein SAMN05216388_101737 [Halorientalis persicus]|uniref:Uncharacterized protein n=2 Tax=Halorientalis persicus TaxID=1367881 RepID=A0A1H8RUC4_9EURY|nr:hypothetical protein SAMN05216388_101737 [Halorientalis persicus]